MSEDRRLLALGNLPNIDLAASEIKAMRKSTAWFGTIFPIHSVITTFGFISDPLLGHSDSGIQPPWLKANKPWVQLFLTIGLGALVPLMFVAALINAWMSSIDLNTIFWSFMALEVALMLGCRSLADTLWHIDFAPSEPYWLDLDRAVHELGLPKDLMLPSFTSVPLDELDAWLLNLGAELKAIAHTSDE